MTAWQVHDPQFAADELNSGLAVSPWSGHRGFAYDLVAWRRPAVVAELGTHYGCSFFAFAQAAKDLDLPVRVLAVDTWQGDPHAGEYGPEVLDVVRRTVEQHFPQQDLVLLQKTFLEAREDVPDGSVDLLHIDGFHSYDAVREDYETWLPKLADDGIVLFHDVASDNGYESPRHWAEVREEHPSLEFLHSFGLGVLFPKGDRWYRALEDEGVLRWADHYRWRAQARLLERQLEDTRQQLEERWQVVQGLEAMVRDRDEALAAQARMLEERWEVMQRDAEEVARARQDRDDAKAQALALEARLALLQTPAGALKHGAGLLRDRLGRSSR